MEQWKELAAMADDDRERQAVETALAASGCWSL
jgi:hypothetical protein